MEDRISTPNTYLTEEELGKRAGLARNAIRAIRQKIEALQTVSLTSIRKLYQALGLTLEVGDHHCGGREAEKNAPVEQDASELQPTGDVQSGEEATGGNDAVEQENNPAYFLRDTNTGKEVRVCFEPLTTDDINALNGMDWQRARFGAVWKVWAEHEVALKLTLCEDAGGLILGIVKLGTMQHIDGAGSLCDSLLEAAPVHRFGEAGRRYHGIGSILVARLVVESKKQGAGGRVLVSPTKDSIPFYRRLGFE